MAKQIYEDHIIKGHSAHLVLCFAEEHEEADLVSCLNHNFFLSYKGCPRFIPQTLFSSGLASHHAVILAYDWKSCKELFWRDFREEIIPPGKGLRGREVEFMEEGCLLCSTSAGYHVGAKLQYPQKEAE